MSIHQTFPENYQQQLEQKISLLKQDFSQFALPELDIYQSPPEHYRQRAEFKIWHEHGKVYYAMYRPGERKKPFIIEDFPVGSLLINSIMPPLLEAVNNSEILARKLFQVEFLTGLSQQALVTLIYHKPLDEHWEKEARKVKEMLNLTIIGRSRKQKICLGRDYITETLKIKDRQYHYQQIEGCFTQPNAKICEKMLAWAQERAKYCSGDLLELYCGNGNFTIPLALHFNKVLATEISKTSVNSARYNLKLNKVDNVQIVRMSSEDFSLAMEGARPFRRLQDIDLKDYDFSTVLVDPPRAGLDDGTLKLLRCFKNILYISCNPQTLKLNLEYLGTTHSIKHFAVFDQFPYTPHLECAVHLTCRETSC